ncbi:MULTISPECIES: LPS export ABC transporter periplasmic protein LptC [unclassified Yoonia]|uniref:LPS export ABC transporter periplasmic protein LptC n=1 Tax=unclassified Yoonia TaxID=2629118 RepID=UPI002AFFE1DA|nr:MULTISPECIES: LPS export ABC transporter periplasmic protein LptC [unclassified Yoonia]
MFGADNLYSQWVGWAKILLPLCAIALLSTLFLFARNPSDATDIPMAQVADLARDQQMTAPEFSGITDTGAVVVVSARSARPAEERPDAASVTDLRVRMDNPDGSRLEMTGVTGELDGRVRSARFTGLVRLNTSTGYVMETSAMTVMIDNGTAMSDGFVEIRAPMGNLTAGQVTFRADGSNRGQQMLFTGGVRLIYQPQD